jgi:hypothetical protein
MNSYLLNVKAHELTWYVQAKNKNGLAAAY